jgi:hypothetical protein
LVTSYFTPSARTASQRKSTTPAHDDIDFPRPIRAASDGAFKEITKRVIESGRSPGLKGKTPEATVAAILAVGSKSGGSFKRVDKTTYTLADDLAESAPAKPKKPEAKPRPKGLSGNARKRTSRNAQTTA